MQYKLNQILVWSLDIFRFETHYKNMFMKLSKLNTTP